MKIETLLPSQLEPDPNNVRRFIKAGTINELAESIHEYGLLENLVVREGETEDSYYIVAGERRWRAINELIKEGRREEEEEIFVVVIDGEGTFENIVENLCREELSQWDMGFRFNELVEAGYTQTDIASRAGKNQGFVSRCVYIAKGLHPASVDILNNLRSKIPVAELSRIASLKDGDGKPDQKAQREAIERNAGLRKYRKRLPKKVTDKARMMRRIAYIQAEMKIPRHAQPYVDAVMNFITGTQKKISFPEEL